MTPVPFSQIDDLGQRGISIAGLILKAMDTSADNAAILSRTVLNRLIRLSHSPYTRDPGIRLMEYEGVKYPGAGAHSIVS